MLPLTPIWPAPVPWFRMLNTSSAASPPAGIDTVRLPVSKLALSTSATTALPLSMTTAPAPSLYARLSPLKFVIVGASLTAVTLTSMVSVALLNAVVPPLLAVVTFVPAVPLV